MSAAGQPHESAATRADLAGLFLVSLATLMHEILLTRIFSVTLWYHFAFLAISVAMFGTALGAILVYLRPGFFTPERTSSQLALSSLAFAGSIVLSFLLYLQIPTFLNRAAALPYVALVYVVCAIPFVWSGVAVCLALTRSPVHAGRLYAADLTGAALGCLLLIGTLKLTDGPTAVLVVATLAAAGAACFAANSSAALRRAALLAVAVLALSAVGHAALVRRHAPILRLATAKGFVESPALYEKWTSFARIRVAGDPAASRRPFGWGFSPGYEPPAPARELDIGIDAASGTILTAFDGALDRLDYLKHDVSNVAHHLRPHAPVLVIGAGGGRDVLSALAFRQPSVVAVEINEAILAALNREFGDFSGHLDRQPGVTFVNDEARSWLARQTGAFGLIQVSLIDTWAATAAGAFALTENSLYTVEAWRIFLDRLEPDGLLTFSRWYRPAKPDEFYRLVCLATVSLQAQGVKSPRQHLAVVTAPSTDTDARTEVGTLLVSREPLTSSDLDRLEHVAAQMRFRLLLTPRASLDPILERIASGADLEGFTRSFPADISAPTDDRPFFFQTGRAASLWDRSTWNRAGRERLKAFLGLGAVLATAVVLCASCLLLPLALTTRKEALRGSAPLFVFFITIGLGFMFVELSQMQRLSLFLGHPSYSLSVVLFSLLLSGGLGSFLVGRADAPAGAPRLALLVVTLLVSGALTPWAVHALQAWETPMRLLTAVTLLVPSGLLMGMAFPLGMRLAADRRALTPWLWGINGAASVCASVLAAVLTLGTGISASYWAGCAAYAMAAVAYVYASRRSPRGSRASSSSTPEGEARG